MSADIATSQSTDSRYVNIVWRLATAELRRSSKLSERDYVDNKNCTLLGAGGQCLVFGVLFVMQTAAHGVSPQ
jgi:hypothetical protein